MKNIILFSALLSLAGCRKEQAAEETKENPASAETRVVSLSEAQLNSAGLETGSPKLLHLSSLVKVSGTIDVPPQNRISVSMPLGGYLRSTQLIPGMPVSKGQVIAVMEDPQYVQLQQDYLTAQTKLEYAERELERQKELNQSKASSDKVLQQAQMEYNSRKIEVAGLAEKLKLVYINPKTLTAAGISKSVNIYAPINGFVSAVNVNPGKYINPSDVMFELVNPASVHLNLKVFEKDLDKLAVGQTLVAYGNNDPDKKYRCRIILISRNLSAERAAEVHCHFENYDKTLVPGRYMNAEIEVKSHQSLAVNEDAVVNFEGTDYVFLANSKNDFEMIRAETGTKENGFIALLNEESLTGKPVVTKGAYTLLMALKNKIEE